MLNLKKLFFQLQDFQQFSQKLQQIQFSDQFKLFFILKNIKMPILHKNLYHNNFSIA